MPVRSNMQAQINYNRRVAKANNDFTVPSLQTAILLLHPEKSWVAIAGWHAAHHCFPYPAIKDQCNAIRSTWQINCP